MNTAIPKVRLGESVHWRHMAQGRCEAPYVFIARSQRGGRLFWRSDYDSVFSEITLNSGDYWHRASQCPW